MSETTLVATGRAQIGFTDAAGIVVRIAGDDQYRLPATARSALEGLDATVPQRASAKVRR